MDIVTVRFQGSILQKIDEIIAEHNFNSRTEFLREAARDKIKKFNDERLLKAFLDFKGKAKTKVSDEALKKIRDEVSKKYAKKLGVNLE